MEDESEVTEDESKAAEDESELTSRDVCGSAGRSNIVDGLPKQTRGGAESAVLRTTRSRRGILPDGFCICKHAAPAAMPSEGLCNLSEASA